MTLHSTRPYVRVGHTPEWWAVAAWVSLGMLMVVGLAGALGVH